MEDSGDTVQKRILLLCKEGDITINRLSIICGISRTTIQNITDRRNKSATMSTIKKICDDLEITLGEFFSTKEFDELEQEIK